MRTLNRDALILTLFVAADAEVLCDGDRDFEHRHRFRFPPDFTPSIQHSKKVIARWNDERLKGKRFAFAIRDATTQKLLGGCEVMPLEGGTANLSFWIYPPHRRRGVASRAVGLVRTVAFSELGFRQLEVVIDPDNIASKTVVVRNGFIAAGMREGRLVYVADK